ncbi:MULTISPECIES: hypothetical protein [Okeania]|nr:MULTISPECIES: hypothetical protein [Okeania]
MILLSYALKKETGDRRQEENYLWIVNEGPLRVYAPPSNFEHSS